MNTYIRVFRILVCVLILYIVSIVSTYNYSRQQTVENTILNITEFTFGGFSANSNFYTVSDEAIDEVFKELSESDVSILYSIITDEKQNWGPINYKLSHLRWQPIS
jgi:hypothetical protein